MADHRVWMRGALVVLYGAAGMVHLVAPDAFLPITPDWVPEPRLVILATGLCEVAGSIGLMTRSFRRMAGLMFALYAIAVFPANLKHAIEGIVVPALPDSWWYHGPRLAAQPVLVWWALFATGWTSWPFSRDRRTLPEGGGPIA